MSVDVSEKNLEWTIECALLAGGPDACPGYSTVAETPAGYPGFLPGGYRRRAPEHYDPALCLDTETAIAFVQATQPREWEKLRQQLGAEARDRFLKRLASEIARRGTLEVLRKGIKTDGCSFRLAYFRPASGLNPEVQKLYEANLFTVVRQLRYSDKHGKSLDLVLCVNGLPLFTAELKNQFTGQTVQQAIQQYRFDRDPKEALFAFGRCLAHFAVDPDLIYVSTHLQGPKTGFLPFNQGRNNGAGNPPSWKGFATAYLWDRVWARDSVLDLVQHFTHVVEEEDDKGRKTGKRSLIFPRYHQLDAVRRLVDDARIAGPGRRYLVQHSAGAARATRSPGSLTSSRSCTTPATPGSSTRSSSSPTGGYWIVSSSGRCSSSSRPSGWSRTSTPPPISSRRRSSRARRSSSPLSRSSP